MGATEVARRLEEVTLVTVTTVVEKLKEVRA